MNKRGNISIFVIIGIVIIAVIIFTTSINFKGNQEIDSQISQIKTTIDGCIKETAENSLILIGLQGGYYDPPEESFKNYYVDTAYFFYENEVLTPSITTIENEISKYINENLESCTLEEFEKFPKYQIETKEVTTKTKITKQKITIFVNYPVTIDKNESITRINQFDTEIKNIKFNKIYEAINEVMEEQLKNPDLICTSCLAKISEKYNINFELERIDESTILFKIIDKESIIDEEPYEFGFGTKHQKYICKDSSLNPDDSFYIDCKGL